jgi:hypothetical protein
MSGFESAPVVLNFLSLVGTPRAEQAKADLLQVQDLHAEWLATENELTEARCAHEALKVSRAAEQARVDESLADTERNTEAAERHLSFLRHDIEADEVRWAGLGTPQEWHEQHGPGKVVH